jgi:hypothetical protein
VRAGRPRAAGTARLHTWSGTADADAAEHADVNAVALKVELPADR